MIHLPDVFKKAILLLFFCITPDDYVVSQTHPNIIYIMTDDMGYADLSGYGRKDYQTPNLDILASQGMKFVNAYSAGPLCTPTRTAFMTGRYPARTPVGLMEPLTPSKRDSAFGLTTDYPSIATLLKGGGYETALIGKWHLGSLPQHSPIKNGFDYFFGIHGGAADYISHTGEGGKPDLYENDVLIDAEGYLTDLFTEKAIAFIKKVHHKPFFIAVTFNAPHWPWQGPNDKPYADSMDFRDGGTSAIYAAMMKSLDEGVGKILNALDDQTAKQTLIIFTNDNGGERFSDHGGLSKGKGTLWEGGIKVPAFVRWTGTIEPGVTSQQVVVTMDWTATILSAGGVTFQQNFPLDGIDLMPVLTARNVIVERNLFWRTFQRNKQKAIRNGDWKYLQDENGEYLFNLTDDPGEQNNLKEKQPTILNRLRAEFHNWEKTVLQPIPL